jgi:hypothetical protein
MTVMEGLQFVMTSTINVGRIFRQFVETMSQINTLLICYLSSSWHRFQLAVNLQAMDNQISLPSNFCQICTSPSKLGMTKEDQIQAFCNTFQAQ